VPATAEAGARAATPFLNGSPLQQPASPAHKARCDQSTGADADSRNFDRSKVKTVTSTKFVKRNDQSDASINISAVDTRRR
jgi:hypothetical protein